MTGFILAKEKYEGDAEVWREECQRLLEQLDESHQREDRLKHLLRKAQEDDPADWWKNGRSN